MPVMVPPDIALLFSAQPSWPRPTSPSGGPPMR